MVRKQSLSPRREKFAQLVAGGSSHADAYRQAFTVSGMKKAILWSEASRVAAVPEVSARIGELRQAQVRVAMQDMGQLGASVLRRLDQLADHAETESARVTLHSPAWARWAERAVTFCQIDPKDFIALG